MCGRQRQYQRGRGLIEKVRVVDYYDGDDTDVLPTEHLDERRDEVGRRLEPRRKEMGEGTVGDRGRRLGGKDSDRGAFSYRLGGEP
jgi:hypothetical protein